ncbi:MAG: peptidase M16 [Gemmatimonadales bacterium]|nr:MAG: peptidase M16 [Gemmatimonadales bacterium]
MSWTEGVTKEVLPNGLTLLLKPDPGLRTVAVVTHVRAGYFDEPDEWVGISHVLEHMFFKGTARRGPGELAREIQLLGGYLNAATSYEKTVYYAVLPAAPGALEKALEVQADALLNCALDPAELAREIEVIVQESRRKLDSPAAVVAETLFAQLFRVHRIRRWRIGKEEELRRLKREDLEAYYRSRYTPQRTILCVAGCFTAAAAREIVLRLYGDWRPPAAQVPPGPAEPGERPEGKIAVLRGDVQRPLAAVGWRTVDALHPDSIPLDLCAVAVGSGRGSRLWRKLRKPGLATSVSASHFSPPEVGVFAISLEAQEEKLDAAVLAALEVVQEGIRTLGAGDLERARALLANQWALRFETADGYAAALCEFEALGGYRLADEFYRRLMDTGAEEVASAASRYLDRQSVCGVVYLPPGGRTALEERWPPAVSPVAAPDPELAVPVAAASRKVVRGERREWAGGVTHLALDGVDFLVLPVRRAGLVSLGLFVPGMRNLESEHDAGISALTVRAALRGAGGMNADQLALAAERLGGVIGSSAGAEAVGWTITVPSAALPEAAELLRRVAREPHLEDADVEVERSVQVDAASRLRDDMFAYPVQQVLRLGFGTDPYGLPPLGDPEVLREMAPERVRDWWRKLAAARAVAIAVGDLEAEALLEGLAPLAEWPRAEADSFRRDPAPWNPGSASEERKKEQTALAMAFPAASAGSPDRFALDVMAALLSGLAGRLFKALRDTRGLAYTVTASPWLAVRGGAMITYVATSPEKENQAREAMLEELYRLGGGPIDGGELERARNYAAGLVQIARQRTRNLVSEMMEAWLNGFLDRWDREPETLREVAAGEVADLARRIFREESRAEYAVRGRSG